jgi:hypothetical protein
MILLEMKRLAEVHVRWLAPSEGGRKIGVAVRSDPPRGYCPHFRVGVDGEYLGVRFLDGEPEIVEPGGSGTAVVELLWDGVDYSPLASGVQFDVLEGPKVVGRGTIARRFEAP